MSNLKVAVRVRPMSEKEIEINSFPSVIVENGEVSVTNIKVPVHHAGDSRERIRKFAFDYCFNENSTQDDIFSMIETEVANALSHRYHACVLAYGQSSTGKTYTMMGLQNEPGLTPRLCEKVFKYFQSSVTDDEIKEMRTSVSYLEIYNERVQDLLSPINHGKSLKVREHPRKGPYVENLSEHAVNNSEELLSYLLIGNGNRRVAATLNNRRSSRSHSVFTITSSSSSSKNSCSRLHLVDLAGSERANSVHQDQKHARSLSIRPRLKEGANINRSLVALGNVICALADQSGKSFKNSRKRFVPYRDSILTWLLKETLSGNSKTVMIATISPASSSYSETVNTLRFGQRAKQIVNRPVVNEDAKEILIRELRAEILKLKQLLNLQTIQLPHPENINYPNIEMSEPPNQEEIPVAEEENICTSNIENSEPIKPEIISNIEPVIVESEEEILEKQNVNIEETKINEESPTNEEIVNAKEDSADYTKTDKLIPVIDITSTIKPKQKTVPLSRTLSVDFPKSVLGKFKREFGSHETLNPKARRPSIRESIENLPLKIEQAETPSRSGSISESSGKSTPKRELTQTRRVHRRSDVVAAVTQRLYSKTIRKDDKSMEETTRSIFPRQNLCSTTRMKLQDFTHRALRASKRKTHSETQTETIASTLRVKEKSTDVQDMNLSLLKVKDANISAVTDVQSVGVNCRVENYSTTIKLTRSCSSQTEEQPKPQISFTNYLRNPPLTVHTYSQPIYTSSVNINVSHNFKEEISDDSLEDYQQNIHLSTPDLISNHNSLEQTKSTKVDVKPITHGNINKYPTEKFYSNEYFATKTEFCIAGSSIVPQAINEVIQEISVPVVCLPEIRKIDQFNETCSLLKPHNCTPVQSVQNIEPITKYKIEHPPPSVCVATNTSISSSREESDTDSSISIQPDKKVRFSSQLKRRNMMDAFENFMGEASSLILKLNSVVRQVERSEEIRNKRTIILRQKIQNNIYHDEDETTKECYVQTYFPYHDASSQTFRTHDIIGASSLQEISDTETEENKWEQIVKKSCDKLEQCVKLAEHKSREDERKRFYNNRFNRNNCNVSNNEQLFESLHKFPQPFSSDTDWKYCPNDYSSLETTHSASDYGSLPRRDVGFFRKSPYKNYSPKAYMQQLVAMRKQIVESSRNDLLEELKVPLSTE